MIRTFVVLLQTPTIVSGIHYTGSSISPLLYLIFQIPVFVLQWTVQLYNAHPPFFLIPGKMSEVGMSFWDERKLGLGIARHISISGGCVGERGYHDRWGGVGV